APLMPAAVESNGNGHAHEGGNGNGRLAPADHDFGFGLLIPPSPQGWRHADKPRRVVPLLCLLLPLLIGAVGLAQFNRARFGSVTEFGVRYQLAGFNSFKDFSTLVSARN